MPDDEIDLSPAYAIQERGHFWWAEEIPPEQYPYLPTSAVTGELKITREGRITVQLDGILHRQSGESYHTSSRIEYSALRARRVRGVLRDSGQGVLLFDLAQAGANHPFRTAPTEGFRAARCLVGTEQFAGPIREPTFSEIDADLKGFERWLSAPVLKFRRGKVVSTAKYRKPKEIVYQLQNGRLSLIQRLKITSQGRSEVTWGESDHLRFRPNRAMGIEAVIEFHRWLQDFMTLLADSDYRLEWPQVRWKKYDCKLYFQWTVSKAEPPDFHDYPANFPQVREKFGMLFEKWLVIRDTFGPGVYQYLGTRRGMKLYTENEFIMLISGLESFHGTKYGDIPSPTAMQKVERIVGQISTQRDKKWARGRLARTALPTLEDRIFEAVNALPLGFKEDRLRAFARDCAKLRNDLAHYGGNRSKTVGYSDFISSVMKKNSALGPLCHALILAEIGLDPAEVREWAVERGPAFLRNWFFAEVGLIDHEDSNDRSPG